MDRHARETPPLPVSSYPALILDEHEVEWKSAITHPVSAQHAPYPLADFARPAENPRHDLGSRQDWMRDIQAKQSYPETI